MIGTVDIEVNAKHPEWPLDRFYAFVSSPSAVRVKKVPRKIGEWSITSVYVTANYPDNTSRSVECVKSGEIWIATLPASAQIGESLNGFEITADGTDEHGNLVTGYCLGRGDLEILDRDGTIRVGETTYYFHFCDTVPEHPHKGDVAIIDGALKWYSGTAWVPFGGGGGYITHADFADVTSLENATLKQVGEKVNEILEILKGANT